MLTKKNSQKTEIKASKSVKMASAPFDQDKTTIVVESIKKNSSQSAQFQEHATQNSTVAQTKKNQPKTRITVKFDVGFSNQLFIRGKGANLNWEKGQLMKNIGPDEWMWETEANFTQCEFKTLINDSSYEKGDNHLLNAGASILYTPQF